MHCRKKYYHDVLHLCFCYHTISVCAEIHNFTSKYKKKIQKAGVIIQQGMVRMVCSVLIKNSPQAAFSQLIIPLTKIAKFYLFHLPKGVFEQRLSATGFFLDSERSYLLLNIYFNKNSWEGCSKLYYSKIHKNGCQ